MFDIFRTLFKYKEKESPDALGFFPEKVHVDAFPERRYLWTSRFLVIFAGLSICFNIMLTLCIYLMVPLIGVSPQFYTINKYLNQVEMVQRREIKFPVSDLITEQNIRDYIMARYSLEGDIADILDNWGSESPFFWFSASSVYETFETSEMLSNVQQYKQGVRRGVEIEWVRPLSKGLWQVQFKTYEVNPTQAEPVITNWRATLRIVYARGGTISQEARLFNPYGFVITSYSLAFRGVEGQNESYIATARRRSQGK